MVHVMSFQLAIFFKQHITRPDQFFSSINDAAGNLFDRMPQIIPLPDEVPPEIPREGANKSPNIKMRLCKYLNLIN